MKTGEIIRQGEVLLIAIDSLPKGIKKKNLVLAEGETTGHMHRFNSKQVQVFADDENNQFVEVKSPSKLIHEEHQNLEIPIGKYKVMLQREYDLSQQVRKVMD